MDNHPRWRRRVEADISFALLGCEKDVQQRIDVSWMKWRVVTGMLKGVILPMKFKPKIHNTVM